MTTPNDPNNLPPKLQEIYHKLSEPYIKITEAIAKQPLSPLTSKYGGVPYIPEDEDCLRDEHGYPFLLFAQFNFAEIAEQAGQHPDLPKEGLLQIFLPAFLGLDVFSYNYKENTSQYIRFYPTLPTKPMNQKVGNEIQTFWQDIESLWDINSTDYGHLDKEKDEIFMQKYPYGVTFPVYREIALTFSTKIMQSSGISDVNKETYQLYENLSDEERQMLEETFAGTYGSKLLGFGNYCQGDPRDPFDKDGQLIYLDERRLFFQWQSPQWRNDYRDVFIDFLDLNMFINRSDLKNRHFADMRFHLGTL